jgi:hypothetical protein
MTTASRRDAVVLFVLRSRDGRSHSPENCALDFRSSALGHCGCSASGIPPRNVGDTETSHRSCGIGSARLDGMGRAPSSRNSHHRGYSFRVRLGCNCALCLCLAIGQWTQEVAERVSKVCRASDRNPLVHESSQLTGVFRLAWLFRKRTSRLAQDDTRR